MGIEKKRTKKPKTNQVGCRIRDDEMLRFQDYVNKYGEGSNSIFLRVAIDYFMQHHLIENKD